MENRIKYLIGEFKKIITPGKIKKATERENVNARVDIYTSLVRNAVPETSLGIYNEKIYFFTGQIYEQITNDEFGDFMYDLLQELGLQAGDFRRIESVIKIVLRKVHRNKLVLARNYLVFRNCVLNVNTMKTEPHNKKIVAFSMFDFDYDENNTQCPQWNMFLDTVLPNKTFQLVLQQFLGSLFIDRRVTKLETMLILYGNGANGKSVIFETVKGILGDADMSFFGLSELIENTGERKRNIASINGKRLNYSSELKQITIDRQSDELKKLISGEPIQARDLYSPNFMAADIPMLMVNTNVMPSLMDLSEGMRRRLLVIPFDTQIPREQQNKNLSSELKAEYPAILNWILRGTLAFRKNRYILPTSMLLDRYMRDLLVESSTPLQFMLDKGILVAFSDVIDVPPCWVLIGNLYRAYQTWCRGLLLSPASLHSFAADLKKAGFQKKRTTNGMMIAIYGKPVTDALRKENAPARERDKTAEKELNIVSEKFGIDRASLVCGTEALSKRINIQESVIKKNLKNRSLAGTYVMRDGKHFFNVDLVMALWGDEFFSNLALRRKQADARRYEVIANKDYRRNKEDIDKEMDLVTYPDFGEETDETDN